MGRRGRSSFGDKDHVFFLTTTVVKFGKVFASGERYYYILRDSLNHVLKEHRSALLAYVFMPSHVHLLLAMPAGESVSDLMRDFKKFTSTKIRQRLDRDHNTYWLERLRQNASAIQKQRFKLWMDRFDDLVIISERALRVKIEHIHSNPVRAGLVEAPEDWEFSSARDHAFGNRGFIEVRTDWSAPL